MNTYIAVGGQRLGPFEEAEILAGLAAGRYSGEDLVWREGMAEWQPLRSVYPEAVKEPPPLRGRSSHPSPPMPRTSAAADPAMRFVLPIGRSGWAIAAGYLGLFCLIIFPSPIALIVSIVAIVDIQKSRDSPQPKYGMGRAIFGLVMGILGTGLLAVALIGLALRHR